MARQALRLPGMPAPEVNLSAVTLCDASARREIVALLKAAPPEAAGATERMAGTVPQAQPAAPPYP